jgi:RNA polymerase-binding protein DksA
MAGNSKAVQVKRLERAREQTIIELGRLQEALRIEVDADADEADPDLVEREKVMALVRSMERKLHSIDRALRQAKTGGYGMCERCAQPIAPERLEALPEATMCIQCQTVAERRTRVGTTATQFY